MAPRVVTVAQDGTGDCRTVIRVSPGLYRQPVYVPKTKNLITFTGMSPESTILTWNNTATKIEHHQNRLLPLLLIDSSKCEVASNRSILQSVKWKATND